MIKLRRPHSQVTASASHPPGSSSLPVPRGSRASQTIHRSQSTSGRRCCCPQHVLVMPSVALVAVRVQSMQQRRYNSNNRILNTKCSCECQCQCQWQTDRLSRWQTNGGVTTPALRPPASRRRLTPVCAWTKGGFLAAVPRASW